MIDIVDRLEKLTVSCESTVIKKALEAAVSEIKMQRSEIDRLTNKLRRIDRIIRVPTVRGDFG